MRPVRRQRGEEAAAAVEFAILAPLVLALVFGMLTGALAWNSKQAITHAAREGSRYAAVLPAAPSAEHPTWDDWLSDVVDQTIDAAFGELGDPVPGRYVCVAYVGPGTTVSRTLDGSTETSSSSSCFKDARPPDEPRVQVVAGRDAMFTAVLFPPKIIGLRSEAVSRFEVSGD